ncbi:hypothetical protein JC862_00400 [Morganella morganii]|nr:hypothetical protein [Morganella morganii]QXO46440.1 hypothetical protein JC862_00400 [Morganella morganii]
MLLPQFIHFRLLLYGKQAGKFSPLKHQAGFPFIRNHQQQRQMLHSEGMQQINWQQRG